MAHNTGLKEKILKLRKEGVSYRDIQATLKCSKSTINFHCKNNDLLKVDLKPKPIVDPKEVIKEKYKNYNDINMETFFAEFDKIKLKLHEIGKVHRTYCDWDEIIYTSKSFPYFKTLYMGIEEFVYCTMDRNTGSSATKHHQLRVRYDEINYPLSYFKEKYDKEMLVYEKKIKNKKNLKEINERKEYEKLKEKFEKK